MGQQLVRRRKKPFLKKFNLSRELNKDVPNEKTEFGVHNFFVEHLFVQYCFVFCMIISSVFFVIRSRDVKF